MSCHRTFILCVISGILLTLSFPPYHLGFFGFFCLVPFLMALTQRQSEPPFSLGLVMGFVLYGGTFFWLAWATLPGALGAIGLLSVFMGIFSLIYSYVLKRWGWSAVWLFPFFWTAMEYIRSLGQLGFPWTSICYSQTEYLPFIQFASYVGPYGVSFWLVGINTIIFWSLNQRVRRKYLFFLVPILILIPYFHGKFIIPKNRLPGDFTVALIQPNVDPDVKWDSRFIEHNFEILLRLTREVVSGEPDLVVWPETATPCYLVRQRSRYERVRELVDTEHIYLLTGSPDYAYVDENQYEYFNSAFFFMPSRHEVQQYTKMHLVPFSERIPYDDKIPLLRKINLGEADFTPGRDWTLFHHPQANFAVLICFESIFPQLASGFHKRGADFLVVITNDGWFGKTPAPFQHAQIAVFRAIENRISIARCANTGVSMVIDPYGRITERTPIFVERATLTSFPILKERTFYNQHGEWLSFICVGITVLAIVSAPLQKRNKRHPHDFR